MKAIMRIEEITETEEHKMIPVVRVKIDPMNRYEVLDILKGNQNYKDSYLLVRKVKE